jgi:hypothetical protein
MGLSAMPTQCSARFARHVFEAGSQISIEASLREALGRVEDQHSLVLQQDPHPGGRCLRIGGLPRIRIILRLRPAMYHRTVTNKDTLDLWSRQHVLDLPRQVDCRLASYQSKANNDLGFMTLSDLTGSILWVGLGRAATTVWKSGLGERGQ